MCIFFGNLGIGFSYFKAKTLPQNQLIFSNGSLKVVQQTDEL